MFYFSPDITGTAADPMKSIHIAGTADVQFSAPDSGMYEDVLFYQDANTPDHFVNVFNGGADTTFDGIIYTPNNAIEFSGNADPGGAVSIIGRTVKFTGNANLGSNPDTVLFGPGGANGISLVQ